MIGLSSPAGTSVQRFASSRPTRGGRGRQRCTIGRQESEARPPPLPAQRTVSPDSAESGDTVRRARHRGSARVRPVSNAYFDGVLAPVAPGDAGAPAGLPPLLDPGWAISVRCNSFLA